MAKIFKISKKRMELEDILKGCIRKDQYCQQLLFKRYAELVYTTCRRYDSENYPAKDLMQDTFIKVFDKIDYYDKSKGKFESWISRIAINLALNMIRKQKRSIYELNPNIELTQQMSTDEALHSDLSEEEILTLINNLPPGYKTIFNLFVIDGFSHNDIAKQLQISTSTSKSQLYKARKMLQKRVKDLKKQKYGGF